MLIFLSVLVAACAAAVIVAGLLALLRNQEKGDNRWFAIVCFVVGLWLAANYTDSSLPLHKWLAAPVVKLDFCLAIFVGWSFLQFTAYLVQRVKVAEFWSQSLLSKSFRLISTIINAILVLLVVNNIFFSVTPSTRGVIVHLNVASILYIAVVLPYLAGSLFLISYAYMRAEKHVKRELSLIVIGFAIASLANVLTNLVFPSFIHHEITVKDLNVVGYLGILFLVLCMFTAITARRLFDIHFFVVRAAAYLSTLFIMTFVLVVPIVYIFGFFLDYHPSFVEFGTVVVLSVGVLYLLQYVRQLFDKFTSKIFFRHYYDPQEVLDKLSNVLVRTSDITTLRVSTVQILREAVEPSLIKYILFTDDQGAELARKIGGLSQADTSNVIDIDDADAKNERLVALLKDEGIALAVKLRTTHEDLGYLVLGYKQSGEVFADRDKRLLSVAADEIAISLQNALRFKEIQSFNETLQKRIDDATHRLRESNRKLKVLDETKDDFISMASHQLRTPLTSVKGYISLVLDGDAGPIKPQQRKLLTQSFISSQRMVYLIADLLNVSRLKTGKFIIEATPINLADVVQEEVDQLIETAQGRSLTLTYHKPAHFPELMLDETKIRQVAMNFMDNAIYYTPAGGHITIEVKDTPKTIEFRVNDDGIGVPKEEQHHLFTKFYRAKNAQRARPDGTGLGLFMAQKVVVAQGGAVVFSSKEGQGSTFGFTFPKEKLQSSPTPPAENS